MTARRPIDQTSPAAAAARAEIEGAGCLTYVHGECYALAEHDGRWVLIAQAPSFVALARKIHARVWPKAE